MSNMKNTGGAAFPTTPENVLTDCPLDGGMTLRDYFAAKAMHYYLSTVQEDELSIDGAWTPVSKSDAARHAYIMADAMLKAREQ